MAFIHQNRLLRYAANIALYTPLIIVVVVGGRLAQRMQWPTEIKNTKIETPAPHHAGDVIDISFTVVRRRTCVLQIDRVFERTDDHREFISSHISQLIEADAPPFERKAGYKVSIPPEATPGQYKFFSRFRYLCVALDNFLPWVRRTPSVVLEVVP